MLTPLKHRRWNRIKCTGLCAQVVHITRDHFLINQPEFTKTLTGQTALGFQYYRVLQGCHPEFEKTWRIKVIANSGNFVGKDINKWFRQTVSARWMTLGWVGLEFRSFATDYVTKSSTGTCPQFQQVSSYVGCILAAAVGKARMRLFFQLQYFFKYQNRAANQGGIQQQSFIDQLESNISLTSSSAMANRQEWYRLIKFV